MAKRTRRRKRIVTDDLTLRAFRDRDVDAFVLGLERQSAPVDWFDWFANIDAVGKRDRRLSRKRLFRDLVKAQEGATIYANPGLRFQISSREHPKWMGYVSIYDARWNVHSAAVDYYLLNQYWGQGTAARAVTAALSCCWSDLGLHRVEATVEEINARSVRFTERLGLVYEGTRRHGTHIDRRWRDLRVYSALATDDLVPERHSPQGA
ncbi:MAG: GNAT family protein [Gammaproteobacteria bacterium]|nr:GNAT family protein [Gammaproteobacteria bacterium]